MKTFPRGLAPARPNPHDLRMHDPSEATTATRFPTQRAHSARGWRLVQHAPRPETPHGRDRAGAQRGMLILLAGSAAFWSGVVAVAVHLLH